MLVSKKAIISSLFTALILVNFQSSYAKTPWTDSRGKLPPAGAKIQEEIQPFVCTNGRMSMELPYKLSTKLLVDKVKGIQNAPVIHDIGLPGYLNSRVA
jgi:hypothetical protein